MTNGLGKASTGLQAGFKALGVAAPAGLLVGGGFKAIQSRQAKRIEERLEDLTETGSLWQVGPIRSPTDLRIKFSRIEGTRKALKSLADKKGGSGKLGPANRFLLPVVQLQSLAFRAQVPGTGPSLEQLIQIPGVSSPGINAAKKQLAERKTKLLERIRKNRPPGAGFFGLPILEEAFPTAKQKKAATKKGQPSPDGKLGKKGGKKAGKRNGGGLFDPLELEEKQGRATSTVPIGGSSPGSIASGFGPGANGGAAATVPAEARGAGKGVLVAAAAVAAFFLLRGGA